MKLKVEKDRLAAALAAVKDFTENKDTAPIIATCLITADAEDGVTIRATDTINGIVLPLEAEVLEPGSVCVSARKLHDVVVELAGNLDIRLNGTRLKVKAGDADFGLATLATGDFPAWVETDSDAVAFEVPAGAFRGLLDRVKHAIATGGKKPVLTGLCMHLKGRKLRLVGADGRRMAIAGLELGEAPGKDRKAVISLKAAAGIGRFLKGDEPLSVAVSERHVHFDFLGVKVAAGRYEGGYPEYESAIPQNKRLAVVDRQALIAGLRRVLVMSSEQGGKVLFELEGSNLSLSFSGGDLGTVSDRLDMELEGEPMKVLYNGSHMLEAVKSMDAEKVGMEMDEDAAPGLVRPDSETDHLCVVMPMKG